MKYEPSLVHPLFLHAIETGLQDDSIRTKLRPFLQKTNVTDEELMGQQRSGFRRVRAEG